ITFAADQIGWYAVNVNANDIACMGATPKWFLATILLPEGKTTPNLVNQIFHQITDACTSLNITLAGGHTEITYGLDRPLVIGQMLGEVSKDKLILTKNAQPDDDLLLTKSIAIEATAIIAQELSMLAGEQYEQPYIDRLSNYLHDPGISVTPEASIVTDIEGIHAMHDPTEGGIATGLWEMATAAGVGMEIWYDHLPFDPDSQKLCARFGLDPLGVIASGSLLMAVDPKVTPTIQKQLKKAKIPVTKIGKVTSSEFGVQLIQGDSSNPLPTFIRDEITKLFE
ncbi:MAG: AIR synthase related protein, partial [Chloroflexota bacterium]